MNARVHEGRFRPTGDDAGGCPAASYFLVLAPKKVTKEEGTPLPLNSFGLSAASGRLRNSLRSNSPRRYPSAGSSLKRGKGAVEPVLERFSRGASIAECIASYAGLMDELGFVFINPICFTRCWFGAKTQDYKNYADNHN
jgi:hypothetical protein